MNFLNGFLICQLALNSDMSSINEQMLAGICRDTRDRRSGTQRDTQQVEEHPLFRYDDDRSIKVHLDINGLVGLESVLQTSSGLLPEALQGFACCILHRS